MAKCVNCGKKGFFLKLNSFGKCSECERIALLKDEEHSIREILENSKLQLAKIKEEYANINNSKEKLYNTIKSQAQVDAIAQLEQQLHEKTTLISKIQNEISDKEIVLNNLVEEEAKSQKAISLNANKLLKIRTMLKSLSYSITRSSEEFETSFGNSTGITENIDVTETDELLSTTIKLKLNLLDIRELRKRYNVNYKVIKDLLTKYQARYTTKANMSIYRLMVIALEAELQNTLYNLKYSNLDRSIKDIKAITLKYQKIASDGNQSIAPTISKFIGEIEYLFIEAIKIEYEYYVQKERIKEEQKAIREQMRQEAAERKQLEIERKKIEQEEEKYKKEMLNIESQIKETEDSLIIKQLQERLEKVQSQLNGVIEKKDEIIKLEHGQAGYIYVISNLGSFGENIFKIGMTRRMVPQDRIDELGDASVPFRFDVHCLIFSEKASELERNLHKQLHNKRLNKINLRKEFFKTTIDEIEEMVYNLEPTAVFNKTMLAEQFHQSLAVDEIPDSVEIFDEDNLEEEDDEEEGSLVQVN
jgi:hypothetical protein